MTWCFKALFNDRSVDVCVWRVSNYSRWLRSVLVIPPDAPQRVSEAVLLKIAAGVIFTEVLSEQVKPGAESRMNAPVWYNSVRDARLTASSDAAMTPTLSHTAPSGVHPTGGNRWENSQNTDFAVILNITIYMWKCCIAALQYLSVHFKLNLNYQTAQGQENKKLITFNHFLCPPPEYKL